MIRVLVVDNSLFMRRLIADIFEETPGFEVAGLAQSGEEAINLLSSINPDVITLDYEMPGLNGLETLKEIMRLKPTPVVMLSAHSRKDAEITLKCLHAGAVSFVPKPSGELSLDISKVQKMLLAEVRHAKASHFHAVHELGRRPRIYKAIPRPKDAHLVVMGCSTGGPQTLELLCQGLPADFPTPIIIIQHLPSLAFTESLADRLNRHCLLNVSVAKNGDKLLPGHIYLAPAQYQLHIADSKYGTSQQKIVRLTSDHESDYAPNVDTTMKSAVKHYGAHLLGIILTGMGSDGLQGMKLVKAAGGQTIAEDSSAILYGMPRAVIEAGLADTVIPAKQMADELMRWTVGLVQKSGDATK